jgi:hypothetical protein
MRMHRLLTAVAVAAALGLAGRTVAQDTKTGDRPAAKGDAAHLQHYWDCAKACDDCSRMCDACGAHCTDLVAGGQKGHLETVKTCQDCADVCRAAGAVTARAGPFTGAICTACADACKGCGDACEKHAEHDPIMKRCAEECRKCEQACRDMLKHVGRGTGAERR